MGIERKQGILEPPTGFTRSKIPSDLYSLVIGLIGDCYEPNIHLDVYKAYKSIMPHYPH